MCTKIDFIRFPHLHTIKLCSEPLRRMKTRWKTYEGVYIVLTNKGRKLISQSWGVSELPVGGRSLPLLFLAAGDVRQVQTGSGNPRLQQYTVRTHCFNGKTPKLKLSFHCLKKIDNIFIKGKQTHYFDEKQLVCCQLDAEFTLLVKFAAGSDGFYFFCALVQKENWLSTNRLPCTLCTTEKYYFGKSLGMQKQHVCRKKQVSV